MARLILTHKGAVIKEYPLNQERITVGRKPSCDVQLDDPTVSGQHAAFLMLQNVYIEDLQSTNGTLLNGKKVTKRQLSHGDVIRIGQHEFKFVDEVAQDFESTVVISSPISSSSSQPQAVSVPDKQYVVNVKTGAMAGNQIPLNKPYTTLGTPGTQVAVIAKRGGHYFLMKMSGTVGEKGIPPKVNNRPMVGESQKLSPGDVMEIANCQLEFTEVS